MRVFSITIMWFASITLGFGQTMFNIKVIDLLMLQRITPCAGLHIENKNIRLELTTSYNTNSDQMRYSQTTSHPDKAVRYMHARFGITALRTDNGTKVKDLSGYVKDKYLGNGWWTVKWVKMTGVFTDNLIFEPGFDYSQYFVTTKGDAPIYGSNGQNIGSVVGSNLRVYSAYARLTFQREQEFGVVRYFVEYTRAASMKMDDVKYGAITTGLEGGGNSGFEYRKGGIRVGIEMYANKIISTRFVLGSMPGIKGRNAFATYINLGIPLVFGG